MKKRIYAYIIDVIFIAIILMIISFAFTKSSNESKELNHFDKLNQQMVRSEISFGSYLSEYSKTMYQLDQERKKEYLIYIYLLIIYLIVFPTFTNGRTPGMMICHIVLKDTKKKQIPVSKLFVRSILLYGLGYFFLLLLLQIVISPKFYFIGVSILGIIQILLVIFSVFMIRYKEEKRTFVDIISKTKIQELR